MKEEIPKEDQVSRITAKAPSREYDVELNEHYKFVVSYGDSGWDRIEVTVNQWTGDLEVRSTNGGLCVIPQTNNAVVIRRERRK